MNKHGAIIPVAMIAILVVWANVAVCLHATPSDEERSAAHIEAAISFTIDGPEYSSNQYSDLVSAGGEFTFKVDLPASSPFNYTDLIITWELQTDWNVTVTVEGRTLTWMYTDEANRLINVTVTEKANTSNIVSDQIQMEIVADFDKDDLPDVWERKYFGTIADTDGTGDYDKDGWTDLEEFQNGTDPTIVNAKPGFLETYSWLIILIAIIIVVIVLLIFVILPKMKVQRAEDEKKKIAAAVEVEKSLLGLDELEEKK